MNNLQQIIMDNEMDKLVTIGDYVLDGDGGICTAQVAIKIATEKEHIANFWVDGVLFDGDMEETISDKNEFKYLGKNDLMSWSDVVVITDSESGDEIYVPVAEKEEFDTPDDYLVIGFAAKSLDKIKDGRCLYKELVINNTVSKLKWVFMEDKYPEFKDFEAYMANVTGEQLDNELEACMDAMSDKEICDKIHLYKTVNKYYSNN